MSTICPVCQQEYIQNIPNDTHQHDVVILLPPDEVYQEAAIFDAKRLLSEVENE